MRQHRSIKELFYLYKKKEHHASTTLFFGKKNEITSLIRVFLNGWWQHGELLLGEHTPRERILREGTMAKNVLVRHLNTKCALGTNFFHCTSDIDRTRVLKSCNANVRSAKRACKENEVRIATQYYCSEFMQIGWIL